MSCRFTEALHEEMKRHGVKVSALCPGPTATEFGEVAGFGGNGAFDRVAMDAREVVAAGLNGLDANQRGGRRRGAQQGRRAQHALRSAVRRPQDRRGDQILKTYVSRYVCMRAVTHGLVNEKRRNHGLRPTPSIE